MLIITVPEGARCALYPNVPSNKNYFKGIDPSMAIPATTVTTDCGRCHYGFSNLEEGIYHCTAEMDGCTAVCQIINYTKEKAATGTQLELKLDKLAGNGYEAGYIMLNTQEFVDAQMASDKNSWGKEYADLFVTPYFTRCATRLGRNQQTTNEELADFIAKLDAGCHEMHVFSLGSSPKYGYDIPLILFTKEDVTGLTLDQAAQIIRRNGKPTVQYGAQCHSTEPASAEGALAMVAQLCGKYGQHILDTVDVYIIPRINPDGAVEAIRQSPTTGEDMNRDYLYMNNQEVRMVTAAYNLFLPEVAIDGHEKGNDVLTTGDSICTDMELQVSAGALNNPAIMTETGIEIALTALSRARELGLRGHFYTKLASGAGGYAGSSYYGTRNTISFLVETPGQVHLGTYFMERRVMAHYLFAATVIDYTVAHAQDIMKIVHNSRQHMVKSGAVYDETDVIVLEHGKKETSFWSTPLINVPTGNVTDSDYCASYTEHAVAVRARTRPTAYLIPKGIPHEKEILRVAANHAIGYYQIDAGSTVHVLQYKQINGEIELDKEQDICFINGAYVFPNTVPSAILGVIMEPDFYKGRKNSTLLSMGLIQSDAENRLPLYRYCHDLRNGKISLVNT